MKQLTVSGREPALPGDRLVSLLSEVVYQEGTPFMIGRKSGLFLAATLLALVGGCFGSGNSRIPTYPVTGVVVVDGQPAEAVRITLNNVNGMDPQNPTHSETFSDKDGKFALSTYEQGDGVPEGEYVLTFFWGTINPFNMQYGGPDKLKEKYVDPQSSKFRIKVEKGKPADMGRVELSSK